ncbi:MAG: fasciclin domain-containing protein [Paludibacter sp.]|nr:fasciclin domain-containing protein [Paludibacter sp.]
MKFKKLSFPFIVTLIIALSAISCSDVWDEHYNSGPLNKSSLNLYQYISQDTSLTKFAEMLRVTGYDSILSQSQSFTVWAPTNKSLKMVNITDTALVNNIVKNHITRFSYSTSILVNAGKTLRMFDNKLLKFEKSGAGFTFGGKAIILSDQAMKNGIVHIIGEYAPYTLNFWEYIGQTPDLDSLSVYLKSLNIKTYDLEASFQDGVFVDSVKKTTNIVLDNLAALKTEDSIYTAILPNNTAWKEAYDRISPFFKSTIAEGGATKQMKTAKLVLVKDLFFRGRLANSFSMLDTLKSTNGIKLADPGRLFSGAQRSELSNGYGYVTNKINIEAKESWLSEIRVEAESAAFDASDLVNYTQNNMTALGTGYSVSRGRYLKAESKTQSSLSKLYVNFQIPFTLAAKYNIYCVFVPTSISNANDARTNKVKFYLSYVDATGKQITNAAIDATNTVTTPTKTPAIFTTTPFQVQKMLVANNVVFPFCNLINLPRATVALKIENAAGVSGPDLVSFNRNLLIDCIILEPVQ